MATNKNQKQLLANCGFKHTELSEVVIKKLWDYAFEYSKKHGGSYSKSSIQFMAVEYTKEESERLWKLYRTGEEE